MVKEPVEKLNFQAPPSYAQVKLKTRETAYILGVKFLSGLGEGWKPLPWLSHCSMVYEQQML